MHPTAMEGAREFFRRFYPDADKALKTWAKHNGYNLNVEYSKIQEGHWGDFIVVYRKT